MTAKTNKGNPSAKKKLIPATGMLLASAIALTSATYAWFTMSREVELTGIQMTATVPEDIQISLGHLSDGSPNNNYALNTGKISIKNSGTKATPDNVSAPGSGTSDEDLYDWTNTIQISSYYQMGKLIPASVSASGANVFFTPGANGVGRTLNSGAVSYAAAVGVADKDGSTTITGGSGSLRASLYNGSGAAINTNNTNGWTKYTTASQWNVTNDDGYYVDIPVWCRTSSTQGAALQCVATVSAGPNTTSGTDDDLWMAARVAIIGNTTNGYTAPASGSVTNTILDVQNSSGTSMVDTGNMSRYSKASGYSSGTKYALNASGAISFGTYAAYTVGSGTTTDGVVKLAPGTGSTYGAATPFIVRVWIDGEDINCWNPNAGQDFNINLKFVNATVNN